MDDTKEWCCAHLISSEIISCSHIGEDSWSAKILLVLRLSSWLRHLHCLVQYWRFSNSLLAGFITRLTVSVNARWD